MADQLGLLCLQQHSDYWQAVMHLLLQKHLMLRLHVLHAELIPRLARDEVLSLFRTQV